MALHNELGKKGEEEAARFLEEQGYTIRHKNWRKGHAELDIVAEQANTLIVVEVKSRRNRFFGNPQEAVTAQKIRNLVNATEAYLQAFEIDYPVRFDVITVIGSTAPFCIEHIVEAFYPPIW